MYILYQKQPFSVRNGSRKSGTYTTWRGVQIAMSASEEALREYINRQPKQYRHLYYIEETAFRGNRT